ncbi:hypothetical protein [Xenorhabdus bharatensis]|uniref:hypothetical protein n=1 Tax=Xenorhabdus bharatensis TaxID=3136256 RepID=UPI0030F4A06B
MNIDNNMVLPEKKEESPSITVSIPDGTDVIVEQHIYLVVTVKSPQVKSIKSITIDVTNKNIVVKKKRTGNLSMIINLINLAGRILKKEKEDKKFRVYIPNYLNSRPNNVIIFLIKDENNNSITLESTIIGEVNSAGYNFQLSYEKIPFNKKLGLYYIALDIAANYAYSKSLNVIFEDDSASGTDPNNGGNTGNGNHCDNGLYNKVDVDSNYEDGKFSLKIKSITLI